MPSPTAEARKTCGCADSCKMTSQGATRATAAPPNAEGAPAPEVDKAGRRKTKKKAPRPANPPLGALAAAARDLHPARPGGTFHVPRGTGFTESPSQPDGTTPSMPAAANAAQPAANAAPAAAAPPQPLMYTTPTPNDHSSCPARSASGAAAELTSAADRVAPVGAATVPTPSGNAGAAEVVEPPLAGNVSLAAAPDVADAAPVVTGSDTRGPDAATGPQLAPSFWVDLARGLVELLTHSRGVAGFLASASTEVNATADKFKALVQELKGSVEGMTSDARAKAENGVAKCRVAYAVKLAELFKDGMTTGDVWLGQQTTLAVVHQVVAATLSLSVKDAEEMLNAKRETGRVRDANRTRATLKTSPTVKVFSKSRASFYLQLSDVIVKALKEAVLFTTDADKILAAAVG